LAGQLPGRIRRSVHQWGDVVERHREHVVEDEAQPLGRAQLLQDDQQGEPDRVREQRLLLRIQRVPGAHDRLGYVGGEGFLTPRLARAQHVEGHPGPPTVVSQPPRFSTLLASERLRRSHDSCTASSASLTDPSIR
jgi:hypothetical protein